jgi:hypothetical protein
MRGRGGMRSGGRSGGGKGMNNVDPFNYSVEVKLENAPKNNQN